MDTITSIEKIDTIKESVVTIGNFDGLHRGHQVLIKKATEYAKANNISSVVFTFKNHPVNYFRPGSIKNIITSEEKIKILHTMGVETIYCPDEKNQIDLKKLMADLGNRGIDSILLEGGGTLNDSALRAGIVKEVQAFVAPKLFGGVAGKTPVEGIGVELPSEAVELKYTDICQIGEDIRIKCQVCDKKQEESCLQES